MGCNFVPKVSRVDAIHVQYFIGFVAADGAIPGNCPEALIVSLKRRSSDMTVDVVVIATGAPRGARVFDTALNDCYGFETSCLKRISRTVGMI